MVDAVDLDIEKEVILVLITLSFIYNDKNICKQLMGFIKLLLNHKDYWELPNSYRLNISFKSL